MSRNKGNTLVLILAAVALLSLTTAGYFFWQNQNLQQNTNTNNPPQTSKSPTPPPATQDESANWKTYTADSYSLSYPPELELRHGPSPAGTTYTLLLYKSEFVLDITPLPAKLGSPSLLNNTDIENYVKNELTVRSMQNDRVVNTVFSGQPAQLITFNNPTDSYSLKEFVFLNPNKKLMFAINYSTSNYPPNRSETVLDQILSTFKFTK